MHLRTIDADLQLTNMLQDIKNVSLDDLANIMDRKNNHQKPFPPHIFPLVGTVTQFIESRSQSKIDADELVSLVIEKLDEFIVDKKILNHDLLQKLSIFAELCPPNIHGYAFVTLSVAARAFYNEKILGNNPSSIQLDEQIFNRYETSIRKQINAKVALKEKLEFQCELYLAHLEKKIKTAGKKNVNEYRLSTHGHFNKKYQKLKMYLKKHFSINLHAIGNQLNFNRIPETTQKTIEKCEIVINLQSILDDYQFSLKERLAKFEENFNANRFRLEKRNDTASETFLKVVVSLLSLGLGVPLLWKIAGKSFAKNICSLFAQTYGQIKQDRPSLTLPISKKR